MRGLICGASLLAIALPGAGRAEAPDTPALDEIVVTAERRQESAQTVPVALTVVPGRDLVTRGATSVNDLEYLAPSLEVESAFGGGQPQFRLRGVGFEDYATNNTPTVGTYVDEVAYPIPAATQGLLFDIDRVEVLRGPQGTLYGRNTTGGAINFLTRRPTDRFEAGLTGEYGRFDAVRAEGYLSGPLGEGVAARLSVGTLQGGGFQRNRSDGRGLGDQDILAARGQVTATAGKLDLRLIASWNRDKSDGRGLYLFNPVIGANGAVIQPADTSRRRTGWGLSPSFAALLGLATDTKPFRDNESWSVSLNAGLDLGGARLTSITAYQHLDRRELDDWAALPTGNSDVYFRSHASVFSQELRLASPGGQAFNWLVGGYYDRERLRERYRSDFLDAGFGLSADTPYRQRVDSVSAFGQADYALTDRLKAIAGLRYEHERRRLIGLSTTGVLPNGTLIPFVTPQNRRLTTSEVTGKLGLEYQARPGVLLYATASRGVKSGGFTAVNTLAVAQVDPFRPEKLYAYEVGFKADVTPRLRLNGAAFYYDYHDQQVQGVVLSTVNGTTTRIGRITNAPRSEIHGGELELQWRPLRGLEVNQSLGLKWGEYRRFLDPDLNGVIVNRKGQAIGFPNVSYSGTVAYTAELGGYELTPRGDVSCRDSNTPAVLRASGDRYRVAGYCLVDASLTFAPKDGPWSVALWGRNILNKGYDETRNFFIGGFDVAAPGRPATYGVRGSVRF